MTNLPKIALGAWAWGNDGTFGNNFTAKTLRPIFDAAMTYEYFVTGEKVGDCGRMNA